MRKGSLKYEMCYMLYELGDCIKSDVFEYFKSKYSIQTLSNKLNELKKEGLVLEKTRDKEKLDKFKNDASIIKITPKGKVEIKNIFNSSITPRTKQELSGCENLSKNSDLYARHLQANTAIIYFLTCGVKTYPHEKPSFEYVQKYILLKQTKSKCINPEYLDRGLSKLPSSDMVKAVHKIFAHGVYYTKKEILNAFKEDITKTGADEIQASRMVGIYISNNNMYYVYVPPLGANNRMRVRSLFETKLINSIYGLFKNSTHINPIEKECKPGSKLTYDAKNAIFFVPNGKGMIKSMANISGSDGVIKKRSSPSTIGNIQDTQSKSIIDASYGNYSHIYCVTCNQEGIKDLKMLLKTTAAERKKAANNFMKSAVDSSKYSQIVSSANTFIGKYIKKGFPEMYMTYMPVYDIKLIYELHNMFESSNIYKYLCLLTTEDKVSILAQCIRLNYLNGYRQLHFCIYKKDGNKMKLSNYGEDSALLYNFNGVPSGKAIILKYLEDNGLALKNKNELNNLYKKFGYSTSAQFFNVIYRNYNKPDKDDVYYDIEKDIIPKLTLTTIKELKSKTRVVHISLTENEYATLKDKANAMNMSASSLANEWIHDKLK